MTNTPKAPSGLSRGAAAWWKKVIQDFEFTHAGEVELLGQAAQCLTIVEKCDAAVKRDGMTLIGSRGIPVAHPLLREARQQRAAFAALLYRLGIHHTKEG
jgi:hypothetical protein